LLDGEVLLDWLLSKDTATELVFIKNSKNNVWLNDVRPNGGIAHTTGNYDAITSSPIIQNYWLSSPPTEIQRRKVELVDCSGLALAILTSFNKLPVLSAPIGFANRHKPLCIKAPLYDTRIFAGGLLH